MNNSNVLKSVSVGLGLLVATVSLAGCSPIPNNKPGYVEGSTGGLKTYSVELPDGKFVDCVASQFSGSVIDPSCDWKNVHSADHRSSDESHTLASYFIEVNEGRKVLCVTSHYVGSKTDPDCNWDALDR